MSEWISVKERLPGRGDGNIFIVLSCSNTFYLASPKSPVQFGIYGKWRAWPGGEDLPAIDFWMRLPSLPESPMRKALRMARGALMRSASTYGIGEWIPAALDAIADAEAELDKAAGEKS